MSQNNNHKIVRIFTMPLQYPCGPEAACCGPVGQSEEEVRKLKEAIEKGLSVHVEVRNVTTGKDMRDFRPILGLLRTFGPTSLPFIAIADEVVSMGSSAPEEAVAALREKLEEFGIR
jgi:hypothetical protein